MKVACIILAHQHPEQLLRLVKRLRHPSFDLWIHLDRKCKTGDFKKVFEENNVFAIKPRLDLTWGHFNIVEATINSLKMIMNYSNNYDYIHVMSGMDYPLQQTEFFLEYLERYKGFNFIGNRPLEESEQNIERITKYHFNSLRFPLKYLAERITNIILLERKLPYPFEIRKGPQWMTLSNEAVSYILHFISQNPSFSKFFYYVQAPDEFFFQTILYNSLLKDKMKNQIFHYIDWSEQKKSPKTLTVADKEKLLSTNFFFARKFDVEKDKEIMDIIDNKLAKQAKF